VKFSVGQLVVVSEHNGALVFRQQMGVGTSTLVGIIPEGTRCVVLDVNIVEYSEEVCLLLPDGKTAWTNIDSLKTA